MRWIPTSCGQPLGHHREFLWITRGITQLPVDNSSDRRTGVVYGGTHIRRGRTRGVRRAERTASSGLTSGDDSRCAGFGEVRRVPGEVHRVPEELHRAQGKCTGPGERSAWSGEERAGLEERREGLRGEARRVRGGVRSGRERRVAVPASETAAAASLPGARTALWTGNGGAAVGWRRGVRLGSVALRRWAPVQPGRARPQSASGLRPDRPT